jgi:hypothetical protein
MLHRLFLSLLAVVALSCANTGWAENARLPAEGTPALSVDLPPDWHQKPVDEYGNLDIMHADRHVGIRLAVNEGAFDKVRLRDMAAIQIKTAGFPPYSRTEPGSVSGHAGEAFVGSGANGKGVGLDYRIVWVKVSSTHGIMVARLAATGASPKELEALDAMVNSVRLIVAK